MFIILVYFINKPARVLVPIPEFSRPQEVKIPDPVQCLWGGGWGWYRILCVLADRHVFFVNQSLIIACIHHSINQL